MKICLGHVSSSFIELMHYVYAPCTFISSFFVCLFIFLDRVSLYNCKIEVHLPPRCQDWRHVTLCPAMIFLTSLVLVGLLLFYLILHSHLISVPMKADGYVSWLACAFHHDWNRILGILGPKEMSQRLCVLFTVPENQGFISSIYMVAYNFLQLWFQNIWCPLLRGTRNRSGICTYLQCKHPHTQKLKGKILSWLPVYTPC